MAERSGNSMKLLDSLRDTIRIKGVTGPDDVAVLAADALAAMERRVEEVLGLNAECVKERDDRVNQARSRCLESLGDIADLALGSNHRSTYAVSEVPLLVRNALKDKDDEILRLKGNIKEIKAWQSDTTVNLDPLV